MISEWYLGAPWRFTKELYIQFWKIIYLHHIQISFQTTLFLKDKNIAEMQYPNLTYVLDYI